MYKQSVESGRERVIATGTCSCAWKWGCQGIALERKPVCVLLGLGVRDSGSKCVATQQKAPMAFQSVHIDWLSWNDALLVGRTDQLNIGFQTSRLTDRTSEPFSECTHL